MSATGFWKARLDEMYQHKEERCEDQSQETNRVRITLLGERDFTNEKDDENHDDDDDGDNGKG